ncbi:MAG: universal stress protein [Syntrophales bacterium]|nr:universal stress protein [Syntrophales bacterium]
MIKPKAILVPTDFSSFSDMALKEAADIAGQYGSKIYLLHVIDESIRIFAVDHPIPEDVILKLVDDAVNSSNERLQREVDAIGEAKSTEVIFDVVIGDPAESILTEQKKLAVDLVVIASHGKTGPAKYLMGSVAERVVRGATCPVLVIKSGKIMNKKEAYEQKLQAQLDEWSAEIEKLKAKADSAAGNAKREYHKTIEELRSMQETASNKLTDLKDAGEDAWEDLKAGITIAWDSLSNALKSAASKFK